MPRLCVVIKIYNEFEMLDECIKSLNTQTHKPSAVIIVDDGSPDQGVKNETLRLSQAFPDLNIELIQLPFKKVPNLDTVGRTWKAAWFHLETDSNYDFFGMLDADTRLMPNYYEQIINEMEKHPKIACASGAIKIQTENSEYIEEINIGAKIGRKDARGSGKVIKISFLKEIAEQDFPEVDWDTWINTKAKVRGYSSPQIDNVFMIQERPTTRVAGKNHFRNGRLSYHFGYNPLLVMVKMLLAKSGAVAIFKGYLDARKKKWRLKDDEVRKYFGWRFFTHL